MLGTIKHDKDEEVFVNTHGKRAPLDKPLPDTFLKDGNWSLNQKKTKKEPKKYRTWPAPKPPIILPPIKEKKLDPLPQYNWFDPNYKYFEQDSLEEPVVPILQKIEPETATDKNKEENKDNNDKNRNSRKQSRKSSSGSKKNHWEEL